MKTIKGFAMPDESKIIEVKNYLQLNFPDYEVYHATRSYCQIFDLIHGFDIQGSIKFLKMLWDDNDYKSIAGHLHKVKLAEEINNNVGKHLLVKVDKVVPVE